MNHVPEIQIVTDEEIAALHREDEEFNWDDDLRGLNRSESRDMHHRPPPQWAGELQGAFGAHRQGPNARDW